MGERRIGVALSDPEGRVAVAHSVVSARPVEGAVARIAELAAAEGVERVVVGLPLSLSGGEGPQAGVVRAFAERLARRLTAPMEFWDERLSSVQVERWPSSAGRRRRGRPREAAGGVDALAAAVVLQSYLDRRRGERSH